MYKDYNYIYIDKDICSVVLTKMILKLSFPMTSKIEFNKDSINNMHLTYKYVTIFFCIFPIEYMSLSCLKEIFMEPIQKQQETTVC